MDPDEFQVEINMLRQHSIAICDRVGALAKPFLSMPVERVKTDYSNEIEREKLLDGVPLTKQGSLELLDLLEKQLRRCYRVTVGRSVFSTGRMAYVDSNDAHELGTLKKDIEDQLKMISELREGFEP